MTDNALVKTSSQSTYFHCSLTWFHFFSKHDQILWLAVQLHFAMMLSNSKIKIKIDFMVKCILLTYSCSFFLLSRGIWRLYDELRNVTQTQEFWSQLCLSETVPELCPRFSLQNQELPPHSRIVLRVGINQEPCTQCIGVLSLMDSVSKEVKMTTCLEKN